MADGREPPFHLPSALCLLPSGWLGVRSYALTGSAADATLCPLGRNRIANTNNTTSAPTDGTIQIDFQSCVTVRHVRAAAPAASHAGFCDVYRFATAPDTNAPMKYPTPFVTKLMNPCTAARIRAP